MSLEDSTITLIQNLQNNGAEFEDNNLAFEIILLHAKKSIIQALDKAEEDIKVLENKNNDIRNEDNFYFGKEIGYNDSILTIKEIKTKYSPITE